MQTNSDPIHAFKGEFHRSERLIHLNNAGSAPFPRSVFETVSAWNKRFHEEGAWCVMDAFREREQARFELAAFLGAEPGELAFFPNASSALSQIALGLPLKPGDEILTWDQEYPSDFYPWRVACERAGAKLVVVPSGPKLETPVEALMERASERTRAIAVSWVQFRSGAMTDLKKLADWARPRGIFTCADIIQGAGVLPFDFRAIGIDAAAGGSHKWMMSPHGVGFLCLRKEHVAKFPPLQIGAITFGTPDDAGSLTTPLREDIVRFEPGSPQLFQTLGMLAAVRLLKKTGIDRVAQEAEWLAKKLVHGLRERGYDVHSPHGAHHRGAIVNFGPGRDSPLKTLAEIDSRLKERGIAHAPRRAPGTRLSPHAFNTSEEIDTTLEALSR